MTVKTSDLKAKFRGWTENLKATVQKEAATFEERNLWVAESFRQTEGEPYRELRMARATRHIFQHMPIRIREGEILAGWHPNTHPDAEMKQKFKQAHEYLKKQNYWTTYSDGHMAPDYVTILDVGLGGIGQRIDRLARASSDAPEKAAFYKSTKISLTAFQELILRYAKLAEQMSQQANDPDWQQELIKIADICTHISSQPARNFREAIQLAWFTFMAVAIEGGKGHGCFGLGHLDKYLLKYYRADKQSRDAQACLGRDSSAQDGRQAYETEVDTLLDQVFIKNNEFGELGMSAVIIGVAGRNPDGTDATNELSFKCLETSDRVRTYFPGVDVLWHKDINKEFMEAACRLLLNGKGHPGFFNSDLIIQGLIKYGVPYEHAVYHLPSTCSETSIQGRTNPWVAWPYMNIAECLRAALGNGQPDGSPKNYEELKAFFMKQLEQTCKQAVAKGVRDQRLATQYLPLPLLSCFIQDCLGQGKDISHGGALYNFLQPEAVGVSNVVDGLVAVKTLVDDRHQYTLDDFRAALKNNFDGAHSRLRRSILRDCPKHGNNIPWVNDLFAEIAGQWCSNIEGNRNFYDGPIFPGFLGWTVWISFGEHTSATPDGRKAGLPLANSIGPCTGAPIKGALSSILSTCQFDQSRALGGVIFNLRFPTKVLATGEGINRLKALIESAFENGLFQIQVNIISSEVMRDAQAHPENYSDLLVRIGGYLVPFTLLCKNAQDDVIARTEMEM